MKKNLVYLILGAIIIMAVGVTFVDFDNQIVSVNSEEFANLIDAAFVLQVHEPYYGEIEGTDLVVEDWDNLDSYIDKLPKDKKIAIYCRSGRMSGIVAEQLAERGYDVYDLEGGMNAWQESGKELIVR
ncbi:sulfurtransferase [Candidatus Pacearchaeota archaeon CG10_big_fil_rev_8_21_14_0_10_35_219]|nr:rhodanese-like domain-containing protein [Candidatus Pacearchaeota archaeon]OIO42997.1 MAG: hypothetical protein AUJ63_01065 [Candidatus Pacearchaeota archaeon CG1_02_35_32]PIO08122.1 MAG: sulfurtransferase [Candidatus Pacearchaeota archaeon CG10_big_fil_rev_8_21_14_0_10_35_219]PIY81056.1 MAG: sulfurtransferase [Candidatus Pacearchaeota archaeon CG_4_10_14_0_8_um_filter_35_169]PIZ79928.1 MAG: sulfurtransferase [Candidatus Pacearchaeota archaeon CG_4_10_14_0_2_um_filter_35_33]PJA70234.1 MAG: